ncbi:MAG: tripartite tricarboxylate transporter permease [Chloroflexota bacterium]|nr:tripartite tricarboxylate transporter permease [Chloroflexota bacterium]MDE2885088.1 tripartite tricarboxylate transporter permease [Chloroflexota bacterium]
MESITTALGYLIDPVYWAVLLSVVLLAALASAIPGMNAFLVMALAFPFILFEVEEPAIGLVALATISGVSNTLDSVPAILIGQPSAATQVTFLEGHQLARRGRAAHTLGAVYAVSALGGIVGAVLLTIAIPVARPFVLRFGFPEIAATGMVGIAMVIVLSRGAMVRGLISALVGMLLGIIGTMGRLTVDPFVSMPLVPFIIGLFALPELIDLMMSRRPVAAEGASFGRSEVLRGVGYGISRWKITVRQSAFGVFLGAIPGVGSAVVDWLSYAFGIILTKDRSEFGKGSLDGVLFAESAQNAKEAGAALPTLALGVPGAPTWALVVVAMIPYGIAPGPEMLGSQAHITILLVITLALANLIISGIGVGVTGFLARLTAVPYPIIGAIVIPVALLSTFVDTTSWRGIQIALGVGAMGLVMKRYNWPRPPMILGFILVDVIERNHFNGVSIHGYAGALTRPITITILIIAITVAAVLLRSVARMERETEIAVEEADSEGAARRGWKERLLHPDVLIPIVVIAGVGLLLSDHLQNPVQDRWRFTTYPFWLSSIALVLLVIELGRGVLGRPRVSSIMDLGLVSSGMEGARGAALRMLGLFLLFLLVGTTVGLKWGALAFALAGPVVLLRGHGRWLMALIAAAAVWLFIAIFLDRVLYIIYPEPFLREWFMGSG